LKTFKSQIQKHLAPLIGRKLSIARRAANMRGFHFGHVTVYGDGSGSAGEFALHIQCPWRVEGPDGIVTGEADLWEPADPDADIDWETWNCEDNENLQDLRIGTLLGGYDPATKSPVNTTEFLIVEGVEADEFGGATIVLSGGYRLVIFPSGSTGEDWRLFQPSSPQPHLVIGAGKVEEAPDDAS
jgi:hypothetical protein